MSKITKALVALVLCFTLAFSACTTSWITEAEQIITALLPSVANLITIIESLEGASVQDTQITQTTVGQVTTDLQLIQTLVTEYQTAAASAQPGILGQIQATAVDIQQNLASLLTALHIADAALRAKITAIVGVILAEVQSLIAIVPLVNPAASAATGVHVALTMPLTANEFVNLYNRVMVAKSGNPSLDKVTSQLKIHVHHKFFHF
jgi:hypothetical protein